MTAAHGFKCLLAIGNNVVGEAGLREQFGGHDLIHFLIFGQQNSRRSLIGQAADIVLGGGPRQGMLQRCRGGRTGTSDNAANTAS